MKISTQQLHHLAKLAGLDVEEDIEAHLIKDLQSIISFMNDLTQIDTTGVTPLCHPSEAVHQTLRPDISEVQDWQDEMADQAPDFDSGYYLVPKVIDSES